MKTHACLLIVLMFVSNTIFAQSSNRNDLRNKLEAICSKYKATVGVSVIDIENGDSVSLNNQIRFPMQSVYKFPLALTVLKMVDNGKLTLQQKVFIDKKFSRFFSGSQLKKKYSSDSAYVSIEELLMYMTSYSDNLACDMLFETIGGTAVANKFVHQLGFKNINIKYTEMQVGANSQLMYKNSSTPYEMSLLLEKFYEGKLVSNASRKLLLNDMIVNYTSSARLKGGLPADITVAHKTGTSNQDSVLHACNDVGIIYLPNGKHLAVSVFVMESEEGFDATEKIIATVSNVICDFYRSEMVK